MDYVDAINQLIDLVKYIFGHFGLPDNLIRIEYLVVLAGVFTFLFIVSWTWRKRKAQDRYIDDGVFLEMHVSLMGDVKEQVEKALTFLNKGLVERYKSKKYISIEIFIKPGGKAIFFHIPRNLYNEIDKKLLKSFSLEQSSNIRDNILEEIQKSALVLDFELSRDFVFPLHEFPSDQLIPVLSGHEWIFVQLNCRPARDDWGLLVRKYIDSLMQGKSPSLQQTGCSGGCLSILLPFFTTLGNFLTFLFHGSSVERSNDVNNKGNKAIIKRLRSKESGVGFEFSLRLVINAEFETRRYELADEIVASLEVTEDYSNTITVKNFQNKISSSTKNEFFLAYFPSDTVDILTSQEISRFVSSLI